MGTINDLNTVDTVADDDKFVLWKTQAGATRAITAVDLATYFGAELSDEYQPLDATLTALAALGLENRKLIRGTGVDTGQLVTLSVAQGVFYVADYGAVGDGATDDTAEIQAAIDACEAAGGGEVIFNTGVYVISSTLVINDHNVHLRGQGAIAYVIVANWRQFAATTIKWNGSAGGTMIRIETPTDALHVTQNCDIKGILVDCVALNGTTRAGIGVEILSLRGGIYSDVCVYRPSLAGWNIDIKPGLSSLLDPTEDVQSVLFERCIAYSIWTGADGWRLGKDNVDTGTGNVSLCTWNVCESYTYNGNGFDLYGSDSNILNIRAFVFVGGTGSGLQFNGGSVANKRARGNIVPTYIGNGAIRSIKGTQDPDSNVILNWSEENGAAITDISGKPIWRQSDEGELWVQSARIGATAIDGGPGVSAASVGHQALLQTSIPTNPASGALQFHDAQGRTWTRRGNGLLRPTSVGLNRRRMETIAQNTAATGFSQTGSATIVSDGTATGISITTTNVFTRTPRVQSVSAASSGANAGFRIPSFVYTADNCVARFVFGWETFQTNAAAFIGMKPTGVHGNVDPSSFVSCFGMAIDAGDTTWRIIHNDGSGTATEIDLGANYPANTNATDLYDLLLWWDDGGAAINYQVSRVGTSNIAVGTLSTDLPATTTALNPNIVANTRTGSAAISLSLASCTFEVV